MRWFALFLMLPSSALASTETELPPALRADVSVSYEAGVRWVGFEEDTPDGPVDVGRRQDVSHTLAVRATFAPVDGVAVVIGFDQSLARSLGFPIAQGMLQDPVTGQGSYVGGPALDVADQRGSGLQGVWVGAAFAPFAERYRKQHAVDWRLDLAVRTAPATTWWDVDADGRRGAGEGGATFRAAAAFSRDHGATSPYMTTAWELTTPRAIDVDDGTGQLSSIQVDPGQSLDVRGGVEIDLNQPAEGRTAVFLDLHTGFGYRSARSVPSGVMLPDVLSAWRKGAVVQGEQLGWHVGSALDIDVAKPVLVRLWARAFWALPWRVEHPYLVRTTLDTVQTGFGAELRGRWR